MQIHKELKARCAKEKWRNIGVTNRHHWFWLKNVSLNVDIEIYPRLEIFIFVYVNGSIIEITEPKLEITLKSAARVIIGIYILLNIFNLIVWNI